MKTLHIGIMISSVAASYLLGGAYVCPNDIVTNNFNDGNSSLRACVANASSGSTITFNDDLNISLSSEVSMQYTTLTIDGSAHDIIIDGNNSSRIFSISDSDITLSNLTLKDGSAIEGGAIYSIYSDLNITNSTITSNNCHINLELIP